MSTVGLALIAKNEERRLPELLESIEGAFDQVVLVDTGSVDRTREIFEEWVDDELLRNPNFIGTSGYFHWIKDFGAARTYAHSLLETDWQVWADCDDVIVNAKNIRSVIAQAPDHIMGFVAGYNYAQHPKTGHSICYLRRERIVRRGVSTWINRVHEAQIVNGPVMSLEPSVVEWIHRKQHQSVEEMQAADANRNLDILYQWNEDEPNNSRTLAYIGTEEAAQGNVDKAIPFFERYLMLNPEWVEERAQVHRKLGMCLLIKGRYDEAIETAFAAMKVMPSWTDSYNTLAEAYFGKGDYPKAMEWARESLRRGQPETMLIINPLDYSYQPRKVLAGALAMMKQWDEAVKIGNEAWQLNPLDDSLQAAIMDWRGRAKRDHAANTIGLLVQTLVAHDEQWKALTLLEECVPYFAEGHAGIVNLRSELRERLAWVHDPRTLLTHYAEGGSKPEDFLPDDKVDEVAARLPRTQFLYKGIHDQLIEAHLDGLIEDSQDQVFQALEAISGNPS